MGMQVNFFLNNQPINLPGNFSDLSIELNFDRDDPSAEVSVETWDFYNETAEIIETYLDAGLSGGPGIFEGMPFRIEITKDGQSETFEKYLDLTDNAVLSCDFARITAREKGGIEWLNANADSVTFEYLHKIAGTISTAHYRFMPYVISTVPDYQGVLIAGIGLFVISKELGDAVNQLQQFVSASANIFSAPSEIIKAILFIGYFVTVLVTLIKLLNDIIDLLIQPVKYHAGMYCKTLMEKGFEHFGLNLQSSIWDADPWSNLFLLPQKYQNPRDIGDDRIFGFLNPNPAVQKGYPNKTFGDFLREMKSFFNGKFIFDGSTVLFEREDYVDTNSTYIIPDVEVEEFTTNADELNSNVLIEFRTDLNDKNTIDEYEGTVAQILTEPNVVNNRDHLLMRGLRTIGINYALGKRKTELTGPEKVVKGVLIALGVLMNVFIGVANALIPVINTIGQVIDKLENVLSFFGINLNINIGSVPLLQPVNFGQIVNDRIGMLKLENDFIAVDKLFILREGATNRENKVDVNNGDIVNAERLWNDFHSSLGFATNAGHTANQWKIKSIPKVPFCFDDYRLVKGNARIFDAQGNEAKIESLKWNVEEQTASIRYRYRSVYTTNLNEEIIVPDGR